MRPERTLLVDMGELARGFPMHPERYPDATTVRYTPGNLPESVARDWLQGLDVVFSAETFYDWRLTRWAREAGVATVCQVNPEFYLHSIDPTLRGLEPTVWWAPSPWWMDKLPDDARLVGVPVAADRFAMRPPERDGPLRVLHVAGHRANGDRNGTIATLMALRLLREPTRVTIVTQDARLPRNRRGRLNPGVELDVVTSGVPNYWDLYGGQDVLLLPRRYGGLCLPVQEAMAAGLAVVMTDTEPNDWWPTMRVKVTRRGSVGTPSGPARLHNADPKDIAIALRRLANEPDLLAEQQQRSVAWAEAHSWEAMRPQYDAELALACDRL